MEIVKDPPIAREDILRLDDPDFNPAHVCLVTGAASGIGRATALAAAVSGLTVLALDLNEAGLVETAGMARDLGTSLTAQVCDLGRDEDLRAAVNRATALGQVRYLANVAGVQHIDSIESFPLDKFDLIQRINLRAPFVLAKLTLPLMRRSHDGRGVVGNMASGHAYVCTKNKAAYHIAKFGLRALTQAIAAEGEGLIRSFSISTAWVATGMTLGQIPQHMAKTGLSREEVVAEIMMPKCRIKEIMTPVEVANLFLFGFSKHSKYLIGGDLLYDGGFVLTY